mmetsp:Transcript_7853/g.19594  ORF Transcript_7853/g.19594 Transcript_7853/m.19594 type:complete len:312 (-) Transcript_7853:163-1098(-)
MSTTMEEELLMDMIRDRESQIKKIEKKIEDQGKKMESLAQQKKEIENNATTEMAERREVLEKTRLQFDKLMQQYQQSKDSLDMKKQQQQQQQQQSRNSINAAAPAGLHLYYEIMKAVSTPESTDSSYVIRMQAQLCKAMHSMGMMETQLQLTKQHTETYKKYVKDSITNMVEEKSQIELKFMNELVLADVDRREVETKRNEMSEAFITEKDELMEKIERQRLKDEEDENGEGGDDDEDDEEEKEELKEILEQGKEEIDRLEQENQKEAEKLEELKIKVAEVRGKDIVDDIVMSIAEEFKEMEEEDEDEEED